MKDYMVVTTSTGDTGLRCYPVRAISPTLALRDAMRKDFEDYPDNPSGFSAVEVFQVGRSELSI